MDTGFGCGNIGADKSRSCATWFFFLGSVGRNGTRSRHKGTPFACAICRRSRLLSRGLSKLSRPPRPSHLRSPRQDGSTAVRVRRLAGICARDLALRGLTDLLRPRLPALRPSLLYPQNETQRFVPDVSTGTSGAATNTTCVTHRQKSVSHVSLVSVVTTHRSK